MKNIKLFYFESDSIKNFGDMLNIDICRKLFNVNPVFSPPLECEAAFIGSLLDDFLYGKTKKLSMKFFRPYFKTPVQIWGSGFIADENQYIKRKYNLKETFNRRFNCHAVRGKLSLERLKKIDKLQNFNKTIIGDSGLLISFLLKKQPSKQYSAGIIPHHNEMDMPIWKEIQNNIKNSTIIYVNDTVENVINKVAQCDCILSSAMHGLIAADSLNIPNKRIIASNLIIGGNYKFNDYYSAFDINNHQFLDIRKNSPMGQKLIDLTTISSIIDEYKIDKKLVETIRDNLYNAFPYRN